MFAINAFDPPSNTRPQSVSELRRALTEHRRDLHIRALRLTRDPHVAEDLVQDTVVRAMRFEANFIPGTNARAWLFQILFSVFITRCRRLRREGKALGRLGADPCAWTAQEGGPEMLNVTPALAACMRALPESFRRAVELVDLEEQSYRDAAIALGVPVGTIMSRLHRGRKLLAVALREGEEQLAA